MSSGSLPDMTLVREAFCLAQLVETEGCIHMYPDSSRAVTGTRGTERMLLVPDRVSPQHPSG